MAALGQSMVYLEEAEVLLYDQDRVADAQILKNHVRFRHEDALMYCDSAYFYESTNSLDAFGHVRFNQGDTLFGYCDKMFYNGNTKLARMRRHVRLVDKQTVFTTDSLNYDRVADRAWYWTGGQLQDTVNTLTSRFGVYVSHEHLATFRDSVVLTNPDYHLYSDTLTYNTETYDATISGPTTIIYDDETVITSTRGIHNTDSKQSTLYDHSLVEHSDGKSITADTLFYDKESGYGWGRHDVAVRDTARHNTLYGNLTEIWDKRFDADGKLMSGTHGYVTDSALLVDWSDSTWLYLHADTIRQQEVIWRDSLVEDSTYSIIRALHYARIYKGDTQAVADSAIYCSRDSILSLYGAPVLWQEDQQVSADFIEVFLRDSTVDHAHATGNAIMIQQKTDTFFNQMAGKEMWVWVKDSTVDHVDVEGNAETIFYPQDENTGEWVGMNRTQSNHVTIYLSDGHIDHVLFTSETTGTMYPIDQIPAGEDLLRQFFWAESERPTKPEDVFLHPEKDRTGKRPTPKHKEQEP